MTHSPPSPTFWRACLGVKKVVGLRVLLAAAKANVVNDLLRSAWSEKAPKRVVAAFQSAAISEE